MRIPFKNTDTFPISNFNDEKVTLDQELGERTAAFRDLENEERARLINTHKKLFFLRSNLPIIMVIFMMYEAAVIYFGIQYINNVGFDDAEIFIYLALIPAGLLFGTLKKENNLYKDIGRPVIKTVGTLKTYEKVHRKHTERYFTVEDVRFDKNNNDLQVVNQMLDLFGKNQSFGPIRIEYSPYSKTIWQIKKRSIDNGKWESVYSNPNLPDQITKELPLNQNSNQTISA